MLLTGWNAGTSLRDAPCMRRRHGPEALKPVNEPTWITARDPFGKLLESRELAPYADLRAELLADLKRRTAEGWAIEEPPSERFAGFFCSRDGLRVLVGISSVFRAAHIPMEVRPALSRQLQLTHSI